MRIIKHPILGDIENKKHINIKVDDRVVEALEGEPIAAALISAGIRKFRKTVKTGESRGLFCGIGQCNDCIMEVDGVPNVRTCVTIVREGMVIRTQEGLGKCGGLDD